MQKIKSFLKSVTFPNFKKVGNSVMDTFKKWRTTLAKLFKISLFSRNLTNLSNACKLPSGKLDAPNFAPFLWIELQISSWAGHFSWVFHLTTTRKVWSTIQIRSSPKGMNNFERKCTKIKLLTFYKNLPTEFDFSTPAKHDSNPIKKGHIIMKSYQRLKPHCVTLFEQKPKNSTELVCWYKNFEYACKPNVPISVHFLSINITF